MVGAVWKLREPLGGPYDYVRVVGEFDPGHDRERELVLEPLSEFASPERCPASQMMRLGYEPLTAAEMAQQPWVPVGQAPAPPYRLPTLREGGWGGGDVEGRWEQPKPTHGAPVHADPLGEVD